MRIYRMNDVNIFFANNSDEWNNLAGEDVKLMPAPAAMQPTKYIVNKLKDVSYGLIDSVNVKGVHDESSIIYRLRWRDPTKNITRNDNIDFPDAAALLFPLSSNAPLFMGAPGHRVNLWYWSAHDPELARNDIAEGIGTSQIIEKELISAHAVHDDNYWTIMLRRDFRVNKYVDSLVQFNPGLQLNAAIAVWDGGNQERAGIKAFTPQWIRFEIDV